MQHCGEYQHQQNEKLSLAHTTLNISQFVYQSRPALVFQNSLKLIPARHEPLDSILSIQFGKALRAAGAEQHVSKLISKLLPSPRVLLLTSASTKMRQFRKLLLVLFLFPQSLKPESQQL